VTSERSELRERLQRAGYRPSRRLGQNLLTDPNLARAIVRDARIEPGRLVLEVGPGAGALTRPLLEAGARVLAVEIDARLAAELARSIRADGDEPRLEILRTDVLAHKHALAPDVVARLADEPAWQCVSNLPYSISGPLLATLARLPRPPVGGTVLVQREVADRLTASPSSKAWGPLGVRVQSVFDVSAGRDVPRDVFWPRPAVASRVVHLERRADRGGSAEAARLARLDRLVERVFGQRRKTLARALAAACGGLHGARQALERAGIDGERRAETLSLEELARLAADPAWSGGSSGFE